MYLGLVATEILDLIGTGVTLIDEEIALGASPEVLHGDIIIITPIRTTLGGRVDHGLTGDNFLMLPLIDLLIALGHVKDRALFTVISNLTITIITTTTTTTTTRGVTTTRITTTKTGQTCTTITVTGTDVHNLIITTMVTTTTHQLTQTLLVVLKHALKSGVQRSRSETGKTHPTASQRVLRNWATQLIQ